MDSSLNSLSEVLVRAFEKKPEAHTGQGIRVSAIVSELATWYERLRNAMEYREDEVILRAAIERILKRRLILGGSGKTVAGPLVRELVWARYFPEGSIGEEVIERVSHTVDLYLSLRERIIAQNRIKEGDLNEWVYQLMSAAIQHIFTPEHASETMVNYMFHILRENVSIVDDTEQTRDAQVFIAIRKSYSKNDLAFLRYHLFLQFFGKVTPETLESAANGFPEAKREIERQLNYPLRFKIFSYIKRLTPPFVILNDVFFAHRDDLREVIKNAEVLEKDVIEAAQRRYKSISGKVRRAIVRSVIFILLSKAIFAFLIEGTYDRYVYGHLEWGSFAVNVLTPPILMVIVGLTIRTPDKKNSERILSAIRNLLFSRAPSLGFPIRLRHKTPKTRSFLENLFALLWFAAFALSFGLVIFILTKLHLNVISQGIFIFFLAIVSFLAYRINRTAHLFTFGEKQGLLTPVIDILFLPIAQVGRRLTEGISQINIFLFIFDYIIETPFKGLFSFFEQLFFFLNAKRDYLE